MADPSAKQQQSSTQEREGEENITDKFNVVDEGAVEGEKEDHSRGQARRDPEVLKEHRSKWLAVTDRGGGGKKLSKEGEGRRERA